MVARPEVGVARPSSSRMVVDFPAPFGPRNPVMRPRASSKDRSLTAVFFLNHTATTEIYTLSLHDALPIYAYLQKTQGALAARAAEIARTIAEEVGIDRKSTRLNSSHDQISYAVFCLK